MDRVMDRVTSTMLGTDILFWYQKKETSEYPDFRILYNKIKGKPRYRLLMFESPEFVIQIIEYEDLQSSGF